MKRLSAILLCLLLPAMAQAVPMLINYQGTYVNNAGVPVTQTSVPVVVSIWNDPTNTNAAYRKYQENHTVNINDGQFSFPIGGGSSPVGTFDASLFSNNNALYLQLRINGEDMLPRVRFLSAPYTLQSENSTRFNNQTPSYYEERMCRATPGSKWISSLNVCVGGSANLAGYDFTSLDLSEVILDGALLTNTDLDSADLSGSQLRKLVYDPVKPPSFANTNLSGATLTHMADVSELDLETIGTENLYTNELANCPYKDPTGWTCVSAVSADSDPPFRLVGPGARFSDDPRLPPATWYKTHFPTNLSNTNFRFNHFIECDFEYSTDFSNSNLMGAKFINGSPVEAIWSNTICPDGTNSDDNPQANTCDGHGI